MKIKVRNYKKTIQLKFTINRKERNDNAQSKFWILQLTIDEFYPVDIFNTRIVNQKSYINALGVAGENLFALLGRKKFGTKNPTEGNAQKTNIILRIC